MDQSHINSKKYLRMSVSLLLLNLPPLIAQRLKDGKCPYGLPIIKKAPHKHLIELLEFFVTFQVRIPFKCAFIDLLLYNKVKIQLTIVCLKQAILGLFRILRINKNPLICRRDLMWAVRDSNPRPPGCKPRAEDYFSTAYKITDSYLTLLARNYRQFT